MDVNSNKCDFCFKNSAKYKCPKCDKNYCSIECYKSETHARCSEMFYRDCCLLEAERMGTSEEMKQQMEEILASGQETTDGETGARNTAIEPLEDRIYDLSLDDTDAIWERLTEQERDQFYKFLESDDLKNYIKSWKPWWIFNLVEEAGADSNKNVPKLIKNIIPIDKLISRPPNISNRYSVVSLVLSYAYLTRRYNGDHHSFREEIVDQLIDFCPEVFSTDSIGFDSVESVIGAFVHHATNARSQLNNAFLLLIIDDLFYFLKAEQTDRKYIASALSDIRTILKHGSADTRKWCKKIEFLISWITTSDIFGGFIDELRHELEIGKMVNFRLK